MKKLIVLCSLISFSACSTTYYRDETAETVDMNRFMGKWYVIAHIPTFLEKGAYNATETYSLKKNGKIDIEYLNFGELERSHIKWIRATESDDNFKNDFNGLFIRTKI